MLDIFKLFLNYKSRYEKLLLNHTLSTLLLQLIEQLDGLGLEAADEFALGLHIADSDQSSQALIVLGLVLLHQFVDERVDILGDQGLFVAPCVYTR